MQRGHIDPGWLHLHTNGEQGWTWNRALWRTTHHRTYHTETVITREAGSESKSLKRRG